MIAWIDENRFKLEKRANVFLFGGDGDVEISIAALSFGDDGSFIKIGSLEAVYRELSYGN